MNRTVTVSSKGQITLPKDLRDRHHLKLGEKALVVDVPEGILIRRGRRSLRGILKGSLDVEGMENDIRKLRKEWRL
jgi:AbrB family looped-hinge helix DNA binding protein